tara:strand:+ start:200 stop:1975 length:1776 start_codon:yes stop_codon:yes gene_type:complete
MGDLDNLTTNSQEKSFLELFENKVVYQIPLFQRSYVWTVKKQIEGIQEDFDEIIDEKKNIHFFGAIIMQRLETDVGKTNRYEIIDGQQRLTTIFLFMMAAIFHMRNYDHEYAAILFEKFLIDSASDIENSNLHPSSVDRGQLNWIFQNILSNSDFKEKLKKKKAQFEEFAIGSNSKADGRIRKNYTSFKNYLKLKIDDYQDYEKSTVLKSIITKILNSCKIVSLVVKNPQYGPIIFDKLNSGQEEMNIGELVKNFIFARVAKEKNNIDAVQNFHDTQWKSFIEDFKDDKAAENYFFPLSLIGEPNTKKENVYKNMTNYWNRKNLSSEEIIENLKEYQPAYNALSNQKVEQYSNQIKNSILNLSRINLSITTYPFVMQLLKKLDEDPDFESTALDILKFLEAFLVRRAICEKEPTGLHAVFKRLWENLEKRETFNTKSIKEIINEKHSTQKAPEDEDFIKGIRVVKLAQKKRHLVIFMLEEFDKSLGGEFPEYKKKEIEHILPVKFDNWRNDFNEQDHELLVDTFANLVILSDKLNKEVSNKPYFEKRAHIRDNAMFLSTRKLFDENETWKPEDIRRRSEYLSNWAIKRFPC